MARSKGKASNSLTPEDFRGSNVGDERRREPRIAIAKTISIIPCDKEGESDFYKVQMVDCSLHGIGIISSRRIEIGEQFLAKLRVHQRSILFANTSSRCGDNGKNYRIGAEFTGFIAGVDDDPEEILKALVAEAEKV